ncbi:hypothetical protein RND71_015203 [Anisodus tanguticus]|uniref:DUF4283 domain-containing protein n=1 Tax=Anisodus tanguticus TaxID=243964 RepID=A0AAE1S5T7_9SOLA|nr:hypothetical protein RND71_015203 [Anisodus tanguticus]
MSKQTFEIKEKNKPYLMRTFKWDVSFNPAEESRFAYGWISFPGLSPHYYGESTLFSMAAAVGTPIAVDAATLNKIRSSCARVKVEFDLLKNHPQHVVIQVGEGDGITTELQKIRYDFKPKYCTNCKLQGHDVDGCWNLKPAFRPEKPKDSDGGKVVTAMAKEVATNKGKASNPTPTSTIPRQQAPISTTNALIHAPPTNWITVTRKNKKNKNQNPKQRSKPTGTVTPATGTVIPEPRAIENTAQVSEIDSSPKNDPPKIPDAGNPTGILGGAGNLAGNPTGTLGDAETLPEILPVLPHNPGSHPTATLPAANAIWPPLAQNPLSNPNPNTAPLKTTTNKPTTPPPENHPTTASQVTEIFSATPPPQTATTETIPCPKPPQNPKPLLPETAPSPNPNPPQPDPPENPIPDATPDPEIIPDPQPTSRPIPNTNPRNPSPNPNPSPPPNHIPLSAQPNLNPAQSQKTNLIPKVHNPFQTRAQLQTQFQSQILIPQPQNTTHSQKAQRHKIGSKMPFHFHHNLAL